MSAIKIAFGIICVFIILMGSALAGLNFIIEDTISKKQTDTSAPNEQSLTTEIIFDTQTSKATGTEAIDVSISTDYDPSLEMEYLYVQSENVDASFAELNELQERMYAIADDYDEAEYDMLQEKIDNARTSAKEDRNEEDPYERNSGDGEADSAKEDQNEEYPYGEYSYERDSNDGEADY